MSSSDEAPEEATFAESKLTQKLQLKRQQQAAEAQRHASKQKRRDRDLKLKQQQTQKKKLLSEILQEAEESDEDDNGVATEKAVQIEAPAPERKKKTFAVKDGYNVKISASRVTKKKLPPPKSAASDRREQFLHREQVRRD